MNVQIICPHDGGQIHPIKPTVNRCSICLRDYPVEDGVLRLLAEPNEFYEGAYGNQIRYLPRSEHPWHIWPLWLINSGYLWLTRKYVPEGAAVLELGCGGGVKYFGRRYRMLGCDLSFLALKELADIYTTVVQVDVSLTIPVADQSVDAVVSSFFWEHIRPEIKPVILAECHRVLRPGGKVIFLYDVETENPLIGHYKRKNPAEYQRLFVECDGHFGYQSPEDNLTIFRSAGFQVLDHKGLEKTWVQSASTYSKLIQFSRVAKLLMAWTKIFEQPPWFYMHIAMMRLIDAAICPFLPKGSARVDIVVLEKDAP